MRIKTLITFSLITLFLVSGFAVAGEELLNEDQLIWSDSFEEDELGEYPESWDIINPFTHQLDGTGPIVVDSETIEIPDGEQAVEISALQGAEDAGLELELDNKAEGRVAFFYYHPSESSDNFGVELRDEDNERLVDFWISDGGSVNTHEANDAISQEYDEWYQYVIEWDLNSFHVYQEIAGQLEKITQEYGESFEDGLQGPVAKIAVGEIGSGDKDVKGYIDNFRIFEK